MNGFLVVVRSHDDIPVAFFKSMDEADKFAQKLIDTEQEWLTDQGERIVSKAIDRMGLSAWLLDDRRIIFSVWIIEFRNGFVLRTRVITPCFLYSR